MIQLAGVVTALSGGQPDRHLQGDRQSTEFVAVFVMRQVDDHRLPFGSTGQAGLMTLCRNPPRLGASIKAA